MPTLRIVLPSPGQPPIEIGLIAIRPDGTGICTIRLPMRGEFKVVAAEPDEGEPTIPRGRRRP